MIRRLTTGVAGALAAVLLMGAAPTTLPREAITPRDQMVITHGQVGVAGKPLRYEARTGLLPIYDNDTGRLVARLFIIAYAAERAPGTKPRPLTFIWGGGPGSSSSELHLVGLGPKTLRTPPTYPQYSGPLGARIGEVADNPDTWLGVSDLVFVDPIGTGYSRAVSEEAKTEVYGEIGDAEAVSEAIRLYRTRYDAFDQPLFIAGESYGTTRAMRVADDLTRRRTPLSGVVLISGFYDAGDKTPQFLSAALQLQMYAATAHWWKRLPPDLQTLSSSEAQAKAEAWARETYAPALARREALSPDDRAAITAGIVRFTGLPAAAVDAKTLTVSKSTDLEALLAGRELGRYDSRMATPARPKGTTWLPTIDPSILPMLDIMQGTSVPLIRYLRDTLGYRSDLLYRGPFGEAFHPKPLTSPGPGAPPDDWMTLAWDHGTHASPSPGGPPPLKAAMLRQPSLRVFNVHGLYDESCAALNQSTADTEPALRARVRNACYPAGHMVYTDAAVRRTLLADFASFIAG